MSAMRVLLRSLQRVFAFSAIKCVHLHKTQMEKSENYKKTNRANKTTKKIRDIYWQKKNRTMRSKADERIFIRRHEERKQ